MKIFILASMFFLFACSSPSDSNLKTVDHVNIDQYLGTWHEIARIDHWFQKGCSKSQAEYSLRDDGDISVKNSCFITAKNGPKEAIGRAWVVDKATNAKLKVQFAMPSIKLGFLSGNYWILALDEQYQYVMVGEPKREYFWILARETTLPQDVIDMLMEQASELGFNTDNIIFEQDNPD